MSGKRRSRQFHKILRRVKSLRQSMSNLPDQELSQLTISFKERLRQGESLDDLLPEAYAAICEADYRILGKFPYDVQILGGIALHKGMLAEMNTGEGKTLMATMPLYLNALSGKSTILLTTNDYLALRDAEEMGPVYQFMGLSVATGVSRKTDKSFSNKEKKRIYEADIVYTTHGGLGFDYLINNLVNTASDKFLREFYFVIIDEADSVLLDAAQTPLVISGLPRVQSNLYELADFFVTTLIEGQDYEKEEGSVWLTEAGIRYAEHFFRIDNFYAEEYFEINRRVTFALRAHTLFEKKKSYMVSEDGELQLLDGGSGRLMTGVKLSGGQHQALEAKEKVKISAESRYMASVTFQNLFLMFPKMSGMSGTISDAAEELRDVYHKEVVVIPPNRPVQRKDLSDRCYRNAEEQFTAAMTEAIAIHETGRPVLIVVSTIPETELVSGYLVREKVPHSVLNANNAFWEAEIIKEAGRMNAVTVATGMAGRGTDIKLGEGVKELGGLAVIGIGRMGNTRLERQARGRAGRQGDPGSSRFFVSLQDRVIEENCSARLEKYVAGKWWIGRRRVRRIINAAQRTGEEFAVMSRRQALNHDQIIKFQRDLMYATRERLLEGEGMDEEILLEIAGGNIGRFIRAQIPLTRISLQRYVLDHISYRLDGEIYDIVLEDPVAVQEYLLRLVRYGIKEQEKRIGSRSQLQRFMRVAALTAIDEAWVEQVDYLQQMQMAISGRAMAQRNLVFEFQKDGLEAFEKMKRMIWENIMRNILLSNVYTDEENQLHILFP